MAINQFGTTMLNPLTGATQIPPTQPQPPATPFGAPAPTPPTTAPAAPITPQTNPQGSQAVFPQGGQANQPNVDPNQSNPFALSQAMTAIQNQVANNNTLVNQRNLVLKQLYGVGLTDADKAQLDPGLAAALSGGDRNLIDFNLRLLDDQINGRTNTLNQSIQTLTSGYNTAVQQAETNRQDAITNVLNYAKANGQKPSVILNALYPQLAAQLGPELDAIAAPYGAYIPPTAGSTGITSLGSLLGYYTQGNATTTPGAGYSNAILQQLQGTGLTLNSPPSDLLPYVNQIATGIENGENISSTLLAATNNPGAIEQATAIQYGLPTTPNGYYDPGNGITYAQFADQNTGEQALQNLVSQYIQTGSTPITAAAPSTADPTSNVIDPTTGMTPNAVYQDAIEYMFTGKTPALGLGTQAQTKAARFAIQNQAGALAAATGNTLPQLQALYKSDSAAATQNVERLARVSSVLQSTTANIPRLMTLADQVKAQGIDITEADVQAGAAAALSKFGSPEAASYVELLNTMQSDYSAAQAALAGSRGGQYFASQASDAIPAGLTSDQYKAIGQTIALSSQNAETAINGEVNSLLGVSGGIGISVSGASASTTPADPLGILGQ